MILVQHQRSRISNLSKGAKANSPNKTASTSNAHRWHF